MLAIFLLASCGTTTEEASTAQAETPAAVELDSEVMSTESQAALTPDAVLADLKSGNERYMNNDLTEFDLSAQVSATASGQFPKAVVLSCLDSRIPVEYVFDQSVGDLFVGRVAGNFINTDMLGSMEFGCKVAGSKVIVVMGHQSCGAVKAAIDDVKLGNITPMLTSIKPAVEKSKDFSGEQSTKNGEYVSHVSTLNVEHAINEIREKSPILKEMEDNGEIKIVGALYHMDSGKVEWL